MLIKSWTILYSVINLNFSTLTDKVSRPKTEGRLSIQLMQETSYLTGEYTLYMFKACDLIK